LCYHIGYSYLRLEKNEEALQWFRKYTELWPNDPKAFACLATANCRLGRYAETATALARSILADQGKSDSTALALKNMICVTVCLRNSTPERSDVEEAIQALECAVQVCPRKQVFQMLADCYRLVGDEAKAKEWSRRANRL
jgi:tetratricopeptide (TPR) repeat protein